MSKVIFINTSNIGDLVSSLGFMKKISEGFQDSYILVRKGHEPLLVGESWVETVSVDELSKYEFDSLYDFSSSKVSRKFAKKINARERIGFSKDIFGDIATLFLYTKRVRRRSRHIVEGYNIGNFSEMYLPNMERVSEKIESLVSIHMGARNPIRNIPLHTVIKMVGYLQNMGKKIIVFGDSEEDIEDLLQEYPKTEVFRGDLLELKQLLSSSEIFIGSDSGPLHLASALNIPSIGFYGPNLSQLSGPLKNVIFVERELSCRPCNQNLQCRFGVECLRGLDFENDVKERLNRVLEEVNR
jgi:ADP-heptose:LPS heptosyltransferase